MRELLKQVEEPTPQKSFAIKPKAPKTVPGDEKRYIPAARKRQAVASGQCQYPGCNKPYQHIHHPERFARVRNHENLVALCKDHHEFIHNGLVENEQAPQKYWAINIYKTPDQIDRIYRKYKTPL